MSDPFYLNHEIVENVFYSYLTFSEIYWFETLYKIKRRKSNEKLWLSIIDHHIFKEICGSSEKTYHKLLEAIYLSKAVISGSWIFHKLQVHLPGHKQWEPNDIDFFVLNSIDQQHIVDFLKSIRPQSFETDKREYLVDQVVDVKQIHSVTNYLYEQAHDGLRCQLISIEPEHHMTILDWIKKFDMDFCQFSVRSADQPGSLSLFCSKKGSHQLQNPKEQISFRDPVRHERTIQRVFQYSDRGVKFSFSNEVLKHNLIGERMRTKSTLYIDLENLKLDADLFYRFKTTTKYDGFPNTFNRWCSECKRFSTLYQVGSIVHVELCTHLESCQCCCFLLVCGVRHVHFTGFDQSSDVASILLVEENDLKSKSIIL